MRLTFLCLVVCISWIKGNSFDKTRKVSANTQSINNRIAVLEEKVNYLLELTSCDDTGEQKKNATYVKPSVSSSYNKPSKSATQEDANRTHYDRPENCEQIMANGNKADGVYTIYPKASPRPFEAFCDLNTREGGWTVILNRFNGELSFARVWQDYKTGFGNLNGEFLLGLDYVHYLTECEGTERSELLIVLEDAYYRKTMIHYNFFCISNEQSNYRLTLESFHADPSIENDLWLMRGVEFSTRDRKNGYWRDDNDVYKSEGCKKVNYLGGWWFLGCRRVDSYLTGSYDPGRDGHGEKPMIWKSFSGLERGLRSAKMMVRRQKHRH